MEFSEQDKEKLREYFDKYGYDAPFPEELSGEVERLREVVHNMYDNDLERQLVAAISFLYVDSMPKSLAEKAEQLGMTVKSIIALVREEAARDIENYRAQTVPKTSPMDDSTLAKLIAYDTSANLARNGLVYRNDR